MNSKRVLVIGSGGTGCEVAKLLYLSKHKHLSIVDFDSVEASNLNRQLLFSIYDVKRYKSEVAAEKYRKMFPGAEVFVYVESIYNFGIDFFKEFDLVFGCLDDDDVRRYVSMHCLFCNIPFVDGGSNGFLGQALYFGEDTECFNCLPIKQGKDIPICTVRVSPTEFYHCVVWAKQYFLDKIAKAGHKRYNDPYREFMKEEVEMVGGQEVCTEHIDRINNLFVLLSGRAITGLGKDDKEAMEFVYRCSAARSMSFGIRCKSFLEFESIVESIVPSICTTSSIVASMMFVSYMKKCNLFISKGKNPVIEVQTSGKDLLCTVCSNKALVLRHDGSVTVRNILDTLMRSFGSCTEIYTQNSLIYDRYYRDNLENQLPVQRNRVFYAKTQNGTLVIYNSFNSGCSAVLLSVWDYSLGYAVESTS